MKLTINNIVNRINSLLVDYPLRWEDISVDLDMAIEEINTYMGTKYPPITEILNEESSPNKTYSYRAGGEDVDFFPEKYFHSIVIPYVVVQILSREEEFTNVFYKYQSQYQENLFVMVSKEIHYVPQHLVAAPKGVYFTNPDPTFKEDPESYFNRKIHVPIPRIKVKYSWGNIKKGFVARPLPVDNNSYEINALYAPTVMQTNDFLTLIVDNEQTVIATFVGWSLTKDNQETINGYITLTEDVTLYAVWDYDIIKFKYNGNGGTLANWRPLYVNKHSIPLEGIMPQGGTAVRKGHRFIGFDPIRINKEDIEGTNVDLTDGFSEEELNEINETSPEPKIEFNAQWSKELYTITYHIPEVLANPNRRDYKLGDEFDLLSLVLPENRRDEFIGWWDNQEFLGDPITKIYETDTGNKVFYAKLNTDKYKIIWKDIDDTIILEEVKSFNELLVAPFVNDKGEEYINGLLYELQFDKFIDSKNVEFHSNYRVTKNETFVANYINVPVLKSILLYYKESVNTYGEEPIVLNKHVGINVLKSELISTYIGNDKGEFLDTVEYYVNDISYDENGTSMNDDEFQMPNNDVNIYALYTNDNIQITFFRKHLSGGSLVVNNNPLSSIIVAKDIDSGIIHSFVKLSMDQNDEQAISVEIQNGSFHQYLNGFYIKDNEGVPLPSVLAVNSQVVPFYSNQINNKYIKKLTISGIPTGNLETLRSEEIQFEVGKNINLNELKNEYNNNSLMNKFLEVVSFHNNSNLSPESLITSINLSLDQTIYAKTISRSQYSIIFYINSSHTQSVIAKKIYPFELEPNLMITPSNFGIQFIPNGNQHFLGWNRTPNSETVETSFLVDSSLNQNVALYPVWKPLQGFKVIPIFMFNRTLNFPVIFDKSIEKSYSYILQNSNINLYNTKLITMNDLYNLNPGGQNNKQLRGLELVEHRQRNYDPWSDSWPVYVYLGSAQTEIKEVTCEISMKRKAGYYLMTVRDEVGLVSGWTERDKKVFVVSGVNWRHIVDNELPPISSAYRYGVVNMYGQVIEQSIDFIPTSDLLIGIKFVGMGGGGGI